MNHQEDREGADRQLAHEEEEYRDAISKGKQGAHPPCEKFPIGEARQQEATREGTHGRRNTASSKDDRAKSTTM